MSAFELEDRTCACGNKFSALAIWRDDMPCGECMKGEYRARLTAINERGAHYMVESIGGACPTQAQGRWIDGKRFYFRARHGGWTLSVDPSDAVMGECIATGDDETHGFMTDAAVLAILDREATR